MRIVSWFASLSLGLVVAACSANESGNIGATRFGDTSNPAQRGSPIAALRDACGDGAATPAGADFTRQPYLQHVTSSSAIVGWVTRGTEAQHVEVTLPDGSAVTVVAGAPQQGLVRSAGERQMWARIDGLRPDTLYCYAVTNGTALAAPTGFRTAPNPELDAGRSRIGFLAFGDSGGGGSDQYALLEQMFQLPYELIIHTGDLAYDSGTLDEIERNVFDVYAELFRNLPFFPAAGNHDYKTQEAAPFRSVFALPEAAGEKWYSFDWGPAHFVALDTEADYAAQARWLDDDLAAATAPWKIVYLHRPPYSSGTHGSDSNLRAKLAPVLERHGVQLVLAGHDHHYERIQPQNGVHYVLTGGGGIGTRDVGASSFTAFAEPVIHFVVGEIVADQLILHAIDATGVEFDSVVIPR
jgi:acid phosphatase type 7